MQRWAKNGATGVKIDLKSDKIKFNPDIKAPLVFVDEAAHMNSLQIALLDEYAERVGGTVFWLAILTSLDIQTDRQKI